MKKKEDNSIVTGKAVKGVAWSGMQQIANNGVSFCTYVILARLLDPTDFGLLAFATTITVFLQIFVEQGIPDALIQKKDLTEGHLNAAFWFNLVCSSCIALILVIIANWAADILKEPRVGPMLKVLAPCLILSALGSIQQAILRRKIEFKSLAIQSFITTIFSGVAGVLFAAKGFGVWSLVAQQIVASTTSSLLLWYLSDWRPTTSFSFIELKSLTRFGSHVLASAILDFFNRRSNDLLIGYSLGPSALGLYSIACRLLVTLTRLINAPFNSVAFSAFSRLQNDSVRLSELFNKFTSLTASIAFPVFISVAAIAPDLTKVLFGKQWGSAAPLLSMLCILGVLHSVAFIHGSLIRAAGHADWQMWFTLIGSVLNVSGYLFLVRYGVTYIVAWYVISAYLLLYVDLTLVKKVINHNTFLYLKNFLPSLVQSILIAGSMFSVEMFAKNTTLYIRFSLEILFGLITFVIIHRKNLNDPRSLIKNALK